MGNRIPIFILLTACVINCRHTRTDEDASRYYLYLKGMHFLFDQSAIQNVGVDPRFKTQLKPPGLVRLQGYGQQSPIFVIIV